MLPVVETERQIECSRIFAGTFEAHETTVRLKRNRCPPLRLISTLLAKNRKSASGLKSEVD